MNAFTITRYGRFWAVRDVAGELVCLCVYKRGAVEVARRLQTAAPTTLELHESASPWTGEAGAEIFMDSLGHSLRSTVANLTIGAEQQQNKERSTP